MKVDLPLIKMYSPLVKKVLISLELTAVVSAVSARIHKKS